ncbi:hypothetical protein GF373_16240 [bacterium]|nr:hypothetical protein [bacterium]
MMKKIVLLIPIFLLSLTEIASAQEKTLFEEIAKLFDSPIFFGAIIGSAAFLLLASFLVIKHAGKMEKMAYQWGENKSTEEILELLNSPVKEESQLAYVYLRNFMEEKEHPKVVKSLEKQRDGKGINPTLIHLVEDMQIKSSVPVLESIAKKNDEAAKEASQAIKNIQPEEKKPKKKKA